MSIIRFDEEVDQCFRQHPDLYKKTLREIAIFFLVQGELKYSAVKDVAINKGNFYRMRLMDLDPEYCAKLDKEWKDVSRLDEKE